MNLVQPVEQPSVANIDALSKLVEAAGKVPAQQKVAPLFGTPEGVDAIAHLVSSVAWPIIAIIAIVYFRRQIGQITELELPGGIKAKITRQLKEAAGEAARQVGLSVEPTANELQRAKAVESLAGSADMMFLRLQTDELAAEYERVRASMRPSNDRTREMEKVVAKMRVIGRAAFPLRHELAASQSPGKRLQAIAIMQVEPDEEFFEWLVDRLREERPFIGYHAAVALNIAAAQAGKAPRYLAHLAKAAERAKSIEMPNSPDSDRQRLMSQFLSRVDQLVAPQRAAG